MVTKKERLAALASAYTPAADERTKLAGMRQAAAQAAMMLAAETPYVEEFPTGMPDMAELNKTISESKNVNVDGNINTVVPQTIYTASDGKQFTDQRAYVDYENMLRSNKLTASTTAAANQAGRQSAYDLLYSQFKQYGLESLVEPLKNLIQKDISPAQFTIELRNTPAYQTRFAANQQRIKAGYKALDEATYLGLEDAYQKLMQNYGLPSSYWEKGELGVQPGFEKLIAGNVDPVELENRLVLAVDQIEKGPKEYVNAIKQFYPEISRGDLMAYVLDPANALKAIQSKVKAAQIGGEYMRSGLATGVARAEELSRQGVTAEMARANIPTIIEAATRGGQLADFYARQGVGPYDQATAEEEIYNLGKAAEAKKKRQDITKLEQAAFSGQYGLAQGALARDRAGAY